MLKGIEGCGKLAFALAIAQYLLCESPLAGDSCGECSACRKTAKTIHPDVRFILPIVQKKEGEHHWKTEDYFSMFRPAFLENPFINMADWVAINKGENKQLIIGVEEIRDLRRKMALKAFEGKKKIAIIWNTERMNIQAANAFLKLLEEPPEKTHILLTVCDPAQLLATVGSRCQRLVMNRIPEDDIVSRLMEKHKLSEPDARQIAQIADGSISGADHLVKETNQNILELYKTWLRNCYEGDYEKIHAWSEGLAGEKREFQKMFLGYAVSKLRDSMLFSFQQEQLALISEDEKEFHFKFSKLLNIPVIEEMVRQTEDSLNHVSRNANSHLVFSVLCLKINAALHGKVLA